METSQIGLIVTHVLYIIILIGLLGFAHTTLKALRTINTRLK